MYYIHTKDDMIAPNCCQRLENNLGLMTVKRNNLFVSGKICQFLSS